jgi:hypothetical protein
MKLRLILISVLVLCGGQLGAQNKALEVLKSHVDEISIDTRATFHQEIRAGKYDTHFQGDYLNLHIFGHLTDNITLRVRQRLNKKIDEKNPFNATDFLWLKWQINPKWAITAGKQAILIGGYEIDSPPIDVYYYGAFSNNLYQYYAFGVTGTWTPAPEQNISFQFCPSPISPGTQDAYSYNLYWNGHIGRYWRTTWSYNLVGDELGRWMNYEVFGNKFLLGKLVVDVDFINRHSAHQRNWFFSDWSIIGKAIYSLGKWNFCTKVGYERNDAANVDANGVSYDFTLLAGHNYYYGGVGVEYFPLGNDKLRLHVVYFRDNHDDLYNLDLGITWRFTLYKH